MARRITPIAVDQPVAPTHVLGAELPLDVGPAPDQGEVKQQHATLGAGRRVWVDIQQSWQLKFKQVLRQQALDYSTWKHDQDEKYAAHYKAMYGEGLDPKKRKPDLLTGMLKRVQGMLQPDSSDEVGTSDGDEDDSDEEGDGDEEEGGEDGSSDDAEEGGAGDNNEIDLDKEAETDAGHKKAKRQRFERYEDDFIDDSEIEKVKGGPKVKTQHSGFYVNIGTLAVIEEPIKQRRRAPKQPADPAAAAAGGGGAAKRRKQQEPQHKQQGQQEQQQPKQKQKDGSQQQQQQQQQDASKKRKKPKQGEAAAAGDVSEPSEAAGKKKRARSEVPGAAGAADGAAAAPASKKARKASPATSEAAAAAPPPPAPQAPAGAGVASVAQAAMAAARAAAAARKPAAVGGARGASPAAAALPPAGPGAAKQGAAAAPGPAADGSAAPGSQAQGSAPQEQQQGPRSRRLAPTAMDAAGAQREGSAAAASAAAMSAVFPGGSQPDAAAGGTSMAAAAAAAAAAEQAGAGPAAPVGLPDEIVEAALVLQKAVQENEAAVSGPSATTATRNKVLGAPLSTLGLAFARLPEAQQQHHEAQLLALVGPQLGHLGDKALRKKLLQEPRDKLAAAQEGRERLLEALAGIKGTAAAGGAGAGEGTASDDDFQQAWSSSAEDSLVTAWNAAKAVGGQQAISELALEVAAALGNTAVQGQPDKAASELQQVFNRAKRRQKAAKEEHKAIAAASAAAAAAVAGADGALEAAAMQQAAAAAARTPSRQLSPAPSAAAATAAAPAAVVAAGPLAGIPAAKGQGQQGRDSQDSDTGTDDGGAEAEADGAAGKDAAGVADAGTQAAKVEFSQWSASSPRLQRCVAAAKEAGAPEEWLQEKYTSIRKGSTHGHQAFRILCFAGPAGCSPSEFKGVADKHGLGMQLDDSSKGRHLLKQALSGKGLSSFVGIKESDTHRRALLAFPGVVPKPAKAARASTPAPGGLAEGQGGSGGGAAAD